MADGLNKDVLKELNSMARAATCVQKATEAGIPFAVIPSDYKVEGLASLLYNEYNSTPQRVKANVGVLDPASFIEYYTLFSDPNSRVFASEPDIRVVGVLDYHAAAEGTPRWCQHRVTLTLRQSEEWKRWTVFNNKKFTQEEFAEFLEQNSIDIIKPAPSAMMEVARDLQAKTDVEFGAGVRMQDGQVRFKYTETTKATVGGGAVDVPEQFTVALPVFVGGIRVPMQALLRFRVNGGKLVIWYTLVRPEEVMRQAFLSARDEIATALKVIIINGVPA